MNEKEVNGLLEKYYRGESTEEEERALREYFRGDNIPAGYEAEKEIFTYYRSEREMPAPSPGFEERIMAGIDREGRVEVSLDLRRYLIPLLGAAASILILAGSWFFYARSNQVKDTFSDPEIAYAETMKILVNVSSKMNRATLALEPVTKLNMMTNISFKSLNKSTGIIEKNLKNLEYLKNEPGDADTSEKTN